MLTGSRRAGTRAGGTRGTGAGGAGRPSLTLVMGRRSRGRRRDRPAPAPRPRHPSRIAGRMPAAHGVGPEGRVEVGRHQRFRVGIDVEGRHAPPARAGHHLAETVDVEGDDGGTRGGASSATMPNVSNRDGTATTRAHRAARTSPHPRPTRRTAPGRPRPTPRRAHAPPARPGRCPRRRACRAAARTPAPRRSAAGRAPSARSRGARRTRRRLPGRRTASKASAGTPFPTTSTVSRGLTARSRSAMPSDTATARR